MIEFSKLAKLDHYKKYMVHNVSSNIADTDERNIATVLSSRGMTSKSKKKLSKSDSKLWFNQLDDMELHYFYRALIINPVWNLGFRVDMDWFRTPSFCPFIEKFHPYYDMIGMGHFIKRFQCTCNCTTKFKSRRGLKKHLLNQNNWYHKAVPFLLAALYESKPLQYSENLRSQEDDTVDLNARSSNWGSITQSRSVLHR